jgi:hypothetical protein
VTERACSAPMASPAFTPTRLFDAAMLPLVAPPMSWPVAASIFVMAPRLPFQSGLYTRKKRLLPKLAVVTPLLDRRSPVTLPAVAFTPTRLLALPTVPSKFAALVMLASRPFEFIQVTAPRPPFQADV